MGVFSFRPELRKDYFPPVATGDAGLVFSVKEEMPYKTTMTPADLEIFKKGMEKEYTDALRAFENKENEAQKLLTDNVQENYVKQLAQLKSEREIVASMRNIHLESIGDMLHATSEEREKFNLQTQDFNNRIAELNAEIEDRSYALETSSSVQTTRPKRFTTKEAVHEYYGSLLHFIQKQQLLVDTKDNTL